MRPAVHAGAAGAAAQATVAIIGGAVVAYLASGRWYLVVRLLAVPAYVFIDRYPFAVVTTRLVLAPLVAVTESTSTRKLFWIVHRGLPSRAVLRVRRARRTSCRGGSPIGAGGTDDTGYVLFSYLSIAYTSATPKASAHHLYGAGHPHVSLPAGAAGGARRRGVTDVRARGRVLLVTQADRAPPGRRRRCRVSGSLG
jgi:hypothetical protein